ncbi:Urea active transporter-like protein [Gracilaria domingensis]|nr:Urea active transporter-like protein [Gracilaria domingensis]
MIGGGGGATEARPSEVASENGIANQQRPPRRYPLHDAVGIDQAEEEAVPRKNGEIRSSEVVLDPLYSGNKLKILIDSIGGAQVVRGDVDLEHEDNQCYENDSGVEVAGDKGGLEATRQGVENDAQRNEETRQIDVHARERIDGDTGAQHKHAGDDDICNHCKRQEGQMSEHAPSRAHNLEEGVGRGRTELDEHGNGGEQHDLHGGAGGVPQRPRHAVLEGGVGALQQGGGPGPLRHDDGGGEPGAHGAAGGVEVLGVHDAAEDVLVDEDERDGADAKRKAKRKHDGEADAQRQRRVAEERGATLVLRKVEEVAHDARSELLRAVEREERGRDEGLRRVGHGAGSGLGGGGGQRRGIRRGGGRDGGGMGGRRGGAKICAGGMEAEGGRTDTRAVDRAWPRLAALTRRATYRRRRRLEKRKLL